MRIAWLQDFNIWEIVGGAEQNDREMFKEGIRRGYDIEIITPKTFRGLENYDFAIISNCVSFNPQQLNTIKIPYVIFCHDYYFCRWRLHYPMQDKCKTCIYLPRWKNLFLNSKLNIFLSPLHFKSTLFVMPELEKIPHAEIISAVNTERFKPIKPIEGVRPKEKTVLGINCLYPFKGRDNVLSYINEHPELTFDIVGQKPEDIQLPENVNYLGYIPNEKLPMIMAEHEYLIHLPSTPQPCERIIIEFLLCNPAGKLIVNKEMIGVFSYPWIFKENGKIDREKLREEVKKAPSNFWKNIEEVIK